MRKACIHPEGQNQHRRKSRLLQKVASTQTSSILQNREPPKCLKSKFKSVPEARPLAAADAIGDRSRAAVVANVRAFCSSDSGFQVARHGQNRSSMPWREAQPNSKLKQRSQVSQLRSGGLQLATPWACTRCEVAVLPCKESTAAATPPAKP